MYIHVDHRWFKTILKIDMKKLLALLLIVFSCQFSFAGSGRDEYWLQRDIQIGDARNQYGKKVYGKAARAVMEEIPLANGTGSSVEQLIKRSIAADKPTAAKVGSAMFKRVSAYAKNPGVQMVGVLAVTELLEAVDWVMKDGAYVKELPVEGPYAVGNKDTDYGTGDTREKACQNYAVSFAKNNNSQSTIYVYGTVGIYGDPTPDALWWCYLDKYDYSGYRENAVQTTGKTDLDKIEEPETIPLTPFLLGAMMLGEGYTDPVDPTKYDPIVNTGDYTGVKETYEHDPSGVGDELADAMDDKLKNAKPTDDGKSSYVGDPKYDDRPLGEDDKSSDRSWDEKADEATGGTEPEKDPETGEATGNQSIALKFPLFCSWASKMCLWYDDWKVSDKVHQKFEEDVKNHQKDEKSFWQTAKDWFDWSKENDDLDNDNDLPEIKDIPIGTLDTSAFKGTPGCPSSIQVPVAFAKSGTVEISYEPICAMASKWSFVAPFIGFFSGALIILGVGRKGEDSDT